MGMTRQLYVRPFHTTQYESSVALDLAQLVERLVAQLVERWPNGYGFKSHPRQLFVCFFPNTVMFVHNLCTCQIFF